MKARISEEVREQIKAEPDTMTYTAIAKKYHISDATVNAIRGPRGKRKPSKPRAPRPEPVEIDSPAEDESVTCDIPVSKLDTIYGLLTPYQKAIAVLSGIGEVPEE